MKDLVKQSIQLDKTFTRLQMVTGATTDEINKMKKSYISLAEEMRVSLSTVTDAAEAWLRTGMSVKDTNDALRASVILSTDAFMDGSDATSILVAAQKAYGLQANELLSVVDKLTKLDTSAATTAKDLGEALALSASSAGLAGISMDKYLAILATTSETTQQTAQVVGNAWKTILARLQQVKLGSLTDEEGEDISNVDTLLKQYNIDLMKSTNNLSDLEGLIDVLGKKWNKFTAAQQSEIATVVAGTRQRDKLIATLNNYDRVLELTTLSEESENSALEKFNINIEGTEAKINAFKTAWTGLVDATLKSDSFEWLLELGKGFLDVTQKAGGLVPVLGAALGAFLAFKAVIPILAKVKAAISGIAISSKAMLGAVGVLITLITLVVQASKYIDSIRLEKMQALEDATTARSSEFENERKSITELMSEYVSLMAIQAKTDEQTQRATELHKELSKTLGAEKLAAQDLTKTYGNLVKAYEDKIKASYASQIEEAKEKLEEARQEAEKPSLLWAVLEGLLGTTAKAIQHNEISNEEQAILDSMSESIAKLEAEQNALSKSSENFFNILKDTQAWDRSEQGAEELKKKLESLTAIIKEISNIEVGEQNKETLTELVDTYLALYNGIKEQYDTFISTDFVLTDYYDKQLKALKEQKDLEDKLAEQKEKEKKIADAELKVQEAALDVEQKRALLAEAREKRKAVFRLGRGLVYEEDTKAIESSENELNTSLGNYQTALENLANVQETATNKLIAAVEKLQQAYELAMLGRTEEEQGLVRSFFQTPENLEWYKGLSEEQQLATLMEFMSDENKQKAKSLWRLDEDLISQMGAQVRGKVFGLGDDSPIAQDYLASKSQSAESEVAEPTVQTTQFSEEDKEEMRKMSIEQVKQWLASWYRINRPSEEEYYALLKQIDEIRGEPWYESSATQKGYHTGGIVGKSPFTSDNEMYAKLLKGEIVLPQNKFANIIEKVKNSTNNQSSVLNIGNITLPNVTDSDSFVRELQQISFSQT